MKPGNIRPAPFPTTRWTLISKAAGVDQSTRSEALENLCRIYWHPVFAFITSKGVAKADAEDLTQSFFSEFLRQDAFVRADADRGNLRSYLLKAVQNFMAKHHRNRTRQKRGGNAQHISIDTEIESGEENLHEPKDDLTPEVLFQRQWALSVLNRVVDSLRSRYERTGQGELFEALKFTITPSPTRKPYAEIGKEFGISEGTVKNAAFRLRALYAKTLRATIAETLGEDGDIEGEIRDLRSAL